MGSLSFAAKLPLSLKAVPELIRQKNVSSSSASGQEEAVDGSDGLLLRGRAVPRSARAKSVRPLLEVCVDALVVAAGGETSRSDERVLVFRPADMQDRDKWLLAINRPFHTTNTPSHTIDAISNSLHTTVSPVHAVNDTSLTPSANERGGPCEEQAGRPDAATVEVTCTAEQPTAPAVVQNHWVAAEMATAEHCVPSTVQEHQAAATIQARARKGAFPGAQIPTPQEPQCFACKEADEVCYHFAPQRQHTPRLGLAALNTVTIIWGSQHAIIKDLVELTSLPSLLNALRFSIAACVLSLVWLLCRPRGSGVRWLALTLAGGELGLCQTLGFTLQLYSLNWTTASRSAFLLYLNAPLVPILSWLMGERFIGLRTFGSASLAVAGTLLLTYDGGPPNFGDLLSFSAAVSSALFIVRLSHHSTQHEATGLSVVSLSTTAGLSCLLLAACVLFSPAKGLDRLLSDLVMLGFAAPTWPSVWHGLSLLYLSLVPTALAGWLQAWGQARVKPHEAVIIYTMDPVYGAFFAWLLLGEVLHLQGYAGIALVLSANVLRQLPWEAWQGTRSLLTPLPAEEILERGASVDDKATPLLRTSSM